MQKMHLTAGLIGQADSRTALRLQNAGVMTCLVYAGATRRYVLRLATGGLPALGKKPEQTPFSRRALEGGEARSRPRPNPPSACSLSGPGEAAPGSRPAKGQAALTIDR